ncbi:MAG: class II aldolase/adducin family protein [Deltaproteobacteria bacterium]|nr:MAG: class II aldolase/adducin family protein [Deltaproteobacteria bacterium]
MSEREYFGALTGTGGNVSTIDRHDNIVLITPSNRPWEDMTPDDIRVIDLNLKNIGGAKPDDGEVAMHANVSGVKVSIKAKCVLIRRFSYFSFTYAFYF